MSGFQFRDPAAELDLLVVPSIWYENTPLTILEAFQAGVPVIADPKRADLSAYSGVNVLKPNRVELEMATQLPCDSRLPPVGPAEDYNLHWHLQSFNHARRTQSTVVPP